MNNKHWTLAEDKVLMSYIKESPNNIKKACETASDILGRSVSGCMARWYNNVSKNPQHPCCFIVVSNKHVARNRTRSTGQKLQAPNLFQRVLKLLGL